MNYFIFTIGCQMNKADTERLAGFLEQHGYAAGDENEADLVIANACAVRQSAVDRIHGKLRQWRDLKKSKPDLKLVLTGCVLPKDRQALKRCFDLVLDIRHWDKAISQLEEFLSRKRACPQLSVSPSLQEGGLGEEVEIFHPHPASPVKGEGLMAAKYPESFRALVPIMTGCDQFCSYCAVPLTRGREQSRPVKDVLGEILFLANRGCLEMTLLGQRVNCYQPADPENFSVKNPFHNPFAALLWEINNLPGIERIHFLAPHPTAIDKEVCEALTLPKQVNYLHLPLQSGDDLILQKMGRDYTAEKFLEIVEGVRKQRPQICLGTDVIVGFPGESEKQFQNTIDLYKKIRFDNAYIARYSSRADTKASRLCDDVAQPEKRRRWQILQKVMEEIIMEKNKQYLGKTIPVLVDRHQNSFCFGNSLEMKTVKFSGEKELRGKIVPVKINKTEIFGLAGLQA